MPKAYIALGSNEGDRYSHIRGAILNLASAGVAANRVATIYETEPHGDKNQPWFLNTVMEASTDLDPASLLQVCLSVERLHGRVRRTAGGPRTLDLDIIFYERRIVRLPNLSIPHPRFADRLFVLVPLAQIASEFVDPLSGATVAHLLDAVADASEIRTWTPPRQSPD